MNPPAEALAEGRYDVAFEFFAGGVGFGLHQGEFLLGAGEFFLGQAVGGGGLFVRGRRR